MDTDQKKKKDINNRTLKNKSITIKDDNEIKFLKLNGLNTQYEINQPNQNNDVIIIDDDDDGNNINNNKDLNYDKGSDFEDQYYQRENKQIRNQFKNKSILFSILTSNRTKNQLEEKTPNRFIPPLLSPIQTQQNQQTKVYFGYQEYQFERRHKAQYTTVYFFQIQSSVNTKINFYHEIVVQKQLQKYYFELQIQKLIGYLSEQYDQYYTIICNEIYYNRLNLITDNSAKIPSKYSAVFQEIKNLYKNSGLRILVQKTDNDAITKCYLSNKQFIQNQISSLRIPNTLSDMNTDDISFRNQFNTYLLTPLDELNSSNFNKNYSFSYKSFQEEEEVEIEIVPYFHTPERNSERSCSRSRSRSPLKTK